VVAASAGGEVMVVCGQLQRRVTRVLAIVLSCGALALTEVRAQELEPGAYAVAPVGLNIVLVANTFSVGDLSFDPAGPIDEARSRINVTALGYIRALNLAGRSGQIAIAVPIVVGHLEGRYLGEQAEVTRSGAGDARLRIAINLYGAPVLDRRAFATYRTRRSLGASLTVAMPSGRYSSDRLINVGGDRWAFKPELGFVQGVGRWVFEAYGGVWLFTKNDPFYRGSIRTQDPIASAQFHVHYVVAPRLELSANTNFYAGGRTTLNGRRNLDLQRNSRVGLTMVTRLPRGHTLRTAISGGAYTTIGADFTSVSVAWQRAW
jgi:hypothetical protein